MSESIISDTLATSVRVVAAHREQQRQKLHQQQQEQRRQQQQQDATKQNTVHTSHSERTAQEVEIGANSNATEKDKSNSSQKSSKSMPCAPNRPSRPTAETLVRRRNNFGQTSVDYRSPPPKLPARKAKRFDENSKTIRKLDQKLKNSSGVKVDLDGMRKRRVRERPETAPEIPNAPLLSHSEVESWVEEIRNAKLEKAYLDNPLVVLASLPSSRKQLESIPKAEQIREKSGKRISKLPTVSSMPTLRETENGIKPLSLTPFQFWSSLQKITRKGPLRRKNITKSTTTQGCAKELETSRSDESEFSSNAEEDKDGKDRPNEREREIDPARNQSLSELRWLWREELRDRVADRHLPGYKKNRSKKDKKRQKVVEMKVITRKADAIEVEASSIIPLDADVMIAKQKSPK